MRKEIQKMGIAIKLLQVNIDSDPIIDEWQIKQTNNLINVTNDVIE